MIAEAIKWLWRSRQAPWSAINLTATMTPYILPWYAVRFWCSPEKPFAIELLSARTIRPVGLHLRRSDGNAQPVMRRETEATVLNNLQWTISERGARLVPFERTLFVNLEDQDGDASVDFELKARFLDNRRSEIPVWVRTNSVHVA